MSNRGVHHANEDLQRKVATAEPCASGSSPAGHQFGDKDMHHYFCKTCGISPFSEVAKVPRDYEGNAKAGDRRVNLGCIEGMDPLTLPVRIIDGRLF